MSTSDEREETRLADLVDQYEHAPIGQFSTTMAGVFEQVNATFLAMTGYDRDELVGKRGFKDLLTPAGKIYNETHLNPLLGMQGYVREIAIDLSRADGERIPVLLNAVIRRDADGTPSRIQAVVFDATERRSYERELLVAKRRIERLQRITMAFTSVLSAEQIALEAIKELVDGVKADHGLIVFVDTTDAELTVAEVFADAGTTTDPWHGVSLSAVEPIARAARSGEAVFVEGGDGQDEGVPRLTQAVTRLAILPLAFEGRSFGVLCLASTSQDAFEPDERAFLISFARVCAQAIERARLYGAAEQVARRSKFLSDLSHAFEQANDLFDRSQLLADLLVPAFADIAIVELPSFGPRPVAAQHVDPSLRETVLDLRESVNLPEHSPSLVVRARATGEPQLVSDFAESEYEAFVSNERELEVLRRLGPRSYAALPLVGRGELVGSILLAMSSSGRRYSEDDVPFLMDVAGRAGVALENARLVDHLQTVAQRLQLSFLPESLPSDPRFRLGAWYSPSAELMEIGGDWYDAFKLSGDRLGLAIGDVVGHQMEAVMAMGQLRTALRAFAQAETRPSAVIERLSEFALSVPGALCATVVYAVLDPRQNSLTWACAGHLPPIVAMAGSEPRAVWEGRSPPLGAMPGEPVAEGHIELTSGAAVFFVTDGLIERRGQSIDDGLQTLIDTLAEGERWRSGSVLDELADSLLGGSLQADDVCMLTVVLDGPMAAAEAVREPSAQATKATAATLT